MAQHFGVARRADTIVSLSNGDAILKQWQLVHGVSAEADRTGQVDGYPHRIWHDAKGRAVIEDYRITGMGHGTPFAIQDDDGCGTSGTHMLEVAISSTRHIARFWGLLETGRRTSLMIVGAQHRRFKASPCRNVMPRTAIRLGIVRRKRRGQVQRCPENRRTDAVTLSREEDTRADAELAEQLATLLQSIR